MGSKKTAAATAAEQKKRKREKIEDVGRSKKRKPQDLKQAPSTALVQAQTADGTVAEIAPRAEPAALARSAAWRLTEPMGGCMLDLDPIFSEDEQHFLLAYGSSLQVYATADSLLERRIPLPSGTIVAAVLSPLSPDRTVWVGYADGTVVRVDWTTGAVERLARTDAATTLVDLAVALVPFGREKQEVLFLSEGVEGAWRVVACDAAAPAVTRTLFAHSGKAPMEQLRTADEGRVVAVASGQKLFVGGRQPTADGRQPKTVAELVYQSYAFDAVDEVACLDVRTTLSGGKKSAAIVDLAVGCVRGAIYVYGDVLGRLHKAAAPVEGGRRKDADLRPRKYHWHARAVHAVKWSRDGHYLVSGGAETVLVLWQMDTGRQSFLPHLAASIENIVVSPRGASYALRLDDNSAMVLSTAELQPTCYVSGLQAAAVVGRRDGHVRRAWAETAATTAALATQRQPVPALLSPADPTRLLVRVGNGQRATAHNGDAPSAALVQTFDLATFRSVARQPLARTSATEANTTRRGQPVREPTVTHLCASPDGRWLASVDEWQPPRRDMGGIAEQASWARARREVQLKFWEVDANASTLHLVTRVDEAHQTAQAESILALAADATAVETPRFATLGDDATVRFWAPRQRRADGLAATDDAGRTLLSWHCTGEVSLPLGDGGVVVAGPDGVVVREPASARPRHSGALAFSDDGSTVFAAFGPPDEAVLYTIDAGSGTVRAALPGLFRGHVRGLQSLGAALVLLSADVRVYDVVADELRYGVRLEDETASTADYAGLVQLAVGRLSQTFAVAVPSATSAKSRLPPTGRVLVFSPDHAEPLLDTTVPHAVVSLLPAVGHAGFLAIDAAAQVWSAVDAADTVTVGRPLSELGLTGGEVAAVAKEAEDDEEEEDDQEDAEMDDVNGQAHGDDNDDDDDVQAAVVAPQKLRDIFEAAPATSASIEDLFWEVSGLLSALPLVQTA